jgi:hypothetical protein
LYVEERLEFGGDIFEERENPVAGVFVTKSIEDEAVSGYKRVSVRWNPFNFSRFNTPRKEWKLKTKKAMLKEEAFFLEKI